MYTQKVLPVSHADEWCGENHPTHRFLDTFLSDNRDYIDLIIGA